MTDSIDQYYVSSTIVLGLYIEQPRTESNQTRLELELERKLERQRTAVCRTMIKDGTNRDRTI